MNTNEWVRDGSTPYNELQPLRDVCRDMYQLSDTYIQQLVTGHSPYIPRVSEKEPDNAYQGRLRYGFPMNLFAEGVDSAYGRFIEEYELDISDYSSIPEIQVWAQDMTGSGESIQAVAALLAFYVWSEGFSPWYIEYTQYDPTIVAEDGKVSIQDKVQHNLRPFIKIIPPSDLLEASPAFSGGKTLPGRLRIKNKYSTYQNEEGGFGEKEREVEEVIVITEDTYQVYRKRKGGWELYGEPIKTKLIAGSVMLEEYSFMMGKPPFQDVALIQAILMSAEADNGYITSIAQIPFIFGKNLEKLGERDQVEVGPVWLVLGGENSDIQWVEIAGGSIKVGVERIQRLEERAKSIIGQIFAGTPDGEQTATSQVLAMAGMKRYYGVFLTELENNLTSILNGMLERDNKTAPVGAEVRLVRKQEMQKAETVVDANAQAVEASAGV